MTPLHAQRRDESALCEGGIFEALKKQAERDGEDVHTGNG